MVKPLRLAPDRPTEVDVSLHVGSEVESRSFRLGVFADYRVPNAVPTNLGAPPTTA